MEKGEKPFTPVVSKNQRKKIKLLIMSQGQIYNTRPMDATSRMSP
jgi:hypothetical protein